MLQQVQIKKLPAGGPKFNEGCTEFCESRGADGGNGGEVGVKQGTTRLRRQLPAPVPLTQGPTTRDLDSCSKAIAYLAPAPAPQAQGPPARKVNCRG